MGIDSPHIEEDLLYQKDILQDVSRTFALTIPQLPAPLRDVVGNAYLLCRIADTIEDEEALNPQQKREFSNRWLDVLRGKDEAENFSRDLAKLLTLSATERESDLIVNVYRVIRITNSFPPVQKRALLRCVSIMAEGMAEFQQAASLRGLENLDHFNRYCYHVAGVVGEMLAELFCDYSDEIGTHKDKLITLSSSFGQGLQMTNILKDMWEDHTRGACWLPRSIFLAEGYDLISMSPEQTDARFVKGLHTLIGIARQHLNNALQYTLLIPAHETGIRRFCLWALGMAVLTLRRIHNKPTFKSGQEVKISRRAVRSVVLSTSLFARSDHVLKSLYFSLSHGLPQAKPTP